MGVTRTPNLTGTYRLSIAHMKTLKNFSRSRLRRSLHLHIYSVFLAGSCDSAIDALQFPEAFWQKGELRWKFRWNFLVCLRVFIENVYFFARIFAAHDEFTLGLFSVWNSFDFHMHTPQSLSSFEIQFLHSRRRRPRLQVNRVDREATSWIKTASFIGGISVFASLVQKNELNVAAIGKRRLFWIFATYLRSCYSSCMTLILCSNYESPKVPGLTEYPSSTSTI